jgi:mannose-1-phosphate guanylyltransferase
MSKETVRGVKGPKASIFSNIRSVVLLAGMVRSSDLSTGIHRSVVELPVDDGSRILDVWSAQCAQLAERMERDRLPVVVLLGNEARPPVEIRSTDRVPLIVERDPLQFRGTGGVLRDKAEAYEDDEFLLVGTATQLLLCELTELVSEMSRMQADVTIVSHRDGSPSGLMLVRCGCLRGIPDLGFIDMKEQALPTIARSHVVKVVERGSPTGVSIRTRESYLRGLRIWNRRKRNGSAPEDPFAEDVHSSFGVVEDGAVVDPSARIYDSVILRGAKVLPGAAVVRSVVCPGAVVLRHSTVIEEVRAVPERASETPGEES